MTLLLFGGLSTSLANRFGLRRSQLLFRFGCGRLRTFTTETMGKLPPVICVGVGVVLSPRNGYVREPVVDLLTNSSLFSVSTWISTRSAVCLWVLWLVTA
jgi:hypothetical protein